MCSNPLPYPHVAPSPFCFSSRTGWRFRGQEGRTQQRSGMTGTNLGFLGSLFIRCSYWHFFFLPPLFAISVQKIYFYICNKFLIKNDKCDRVLSASAVRFAAQVTNRPPSDGIPASFIHRDASDTDGASVSACAASKRTHQIARSSVENATIQRFQWWNGTRESVNPCNKSMALMS